MESKSLTDAEEYAKVLYYGRYGSGKTTAAATLANLGLTIAVDFEGGFKKHALQQRGIKVENLRVFQPRSFDEAEQVFYEIKAMFDNGLDITGVIVDNWTELQDILVRESAVDRINKKKRDLEPQLKVSESARNEYAELSEYATQKYDYGVWTNQAKRLARWYQDFPCHTAFVAHEVFEEDTGKIVPAISSKFRNKLAGRVDEVIYTKATDVKGQGLEFTGVGHPVRQFVGKDRLGILPLVLVNPTMERVVSLLNGELDLSSDPAQQAYEARHAKTN
jgi:AAA domain-containing protein